MRRSNIPFGPNVQPITIVDKKRHYAKRYVCYWPHCACRPGSEWTAAKRAEAATRAFHYIISADDTQQPFTQLRLNFLILGTSQN
jgi:hypothetical protein